MKTPALYAMALLFFLSACKKNQLGGNSRIHGTVAHHGRFIAGARLFIKFNSKEFPGRDTTAYDAQVVADNSGHYSVSCYKGTYYIYGIGYDSDINKAVSGGLSVKVRQNEEVLTEVAVTE